VTIQEWSQLKALLPKGAKVEEVYHHKGDASKPHLLRAVVHTFSVDIVLAEVEPVGPGPEAPKPQKRGKKVAL